MFDKKNNIRLIKALTTIEDVLGEQLYEEIGCDTDGNYVAIKLCDDTIIGNTDEAVVWLHESIA